MTLDFVLVQRVLMGLPDWRLEMIGDQIKKCFGYTRDDLDA